MEIANGNPIKLVYSRYLLHGNSEKKSPRFLGHSTATKHQYTVFLRNILILTGICIKIDWMRSFSFCFEKKWFADELLTERSIHKLNLSNKLKHVLVRRTRIQFVKRFFRFCVFIYVINIYGCLMLIKYNFFSIF